MKHKLSYIAILFAVSLFAQDIEYKEYSYTEFFKLIEEEKDTVFKLSDALIKYNPKTDQRFFVEYKIYEEKDTAYAYRNDIVVDKALVLDNVQFLIDDTNRGGGNSDIGGALVDIYFKKNVILNGVASLYLRYCRFESSFELNSNKCSIDEIDLVHWDNWISIDYSHFTSFVYQIFCDNDTKFVNSIIGSHFEAKGENSAFMVANSDTRNFWFEDNFVKNDRAIFLGSLKTEYTTIINNTFECGLIQQNVENVDNQLRWLGNVYSSPVFLEVSPFSPGDNIDLKQFTKGYSPSNSFSAYTMKSVGKYPIHIVKNRAKIIRKYLDSVRVYDANAFSDEISLKSQFYNYFKSRYNTQIANQVYIDLKDFETQRLKVIHNQTPGFRSYFKWKVNQFLKLFSDYGTEPSKAIVVSVYVILFFAFIYLLFPNTWDRHGKNRLMDRYRFFTKYMNKDAGIHEVYLEEQQPELLASEDFKNYMQNAEKHIPKFFLATAMPLYKWSVSGTKLSASLLKRVDVMKGTWQEVPQSKRIWKTLLLVGAFLVAIIYDIFIKVLNALMLSINTFTTLGFGEIPIKGLPRYLAIIQGFIGWFMLTIFSVSLISQLLN